MRRLEKKDFDFLTNPQGPWGFAKITKTYLEWLTGYRSEDSILLVATLNDQIIGYYVNIMTLLKVQNQIVPSCRGSVFVHPEHRRKSYNVFNLLARAVHYEVKNRNWILYGNSGPRLASYYTRKIKMHMIQVIPRYVYSLNPIFYFFRRKPRPVHSVAIKEISFFDERFDDLWEKASDSYSVAVVRKSEFLNWIFQNPEKKFVVLAAEKENSVLEYIVLECHARFGSIIDIFGFKDETITKQLLEGAIEYFKTQKLDFVEFCVSDSYCEKILKSAGFSRRVGNLRHFLVKSYHPEIDPDYIYDSTNWYLTLGDALNS